ncbi:hypothetical protein WN48_08343 [Eufriesea mexicana]|uniref:Uncharacterized protein n=1 Tax=Eufriesea mexicana TaxID=516756 RepID=A0A310SIZ2_9HYME|nr:hypothetical protein WN48_08343 [Eufriesea mexicana]
MKWCLVVLILAGVTRANSVETNYSIDKCPDLNSQEEIDLNELRYIGFNHNDELGTVMEVVTLRTGPDEQRVGQTSLRSDPAA